MRRAIVLAVFVCGGCGGSPSVPDAPGFCSDAHPLAPTFANMTELFTGCTSCHTTGIPLDLDPAVAYADLVNVRAPSYTTPPIDESCGGVLVVPGDPSSSYLDQKLSTTTPCAGAGMPLTDIGTTSSLPACAVRLVHDWIAAGAPAE